MHYIIFPSPCQVGAIIIPFSQMRRLSDMPEVTQKKGQRQDSILTQTQPLGLPWREQVISDLISSLVFPGFTSHSSL